MFNYVFNWTFSFIIILLIYFLININLSCYDDSIIVRIIIYH